MSGFWSDPNVRIWRDAEARGPLDGQRRSAAYCRLTLVGPHRSIMRPVGILAVHIQRLPLLAQATSVNLAALGWSIKD
jgi:hypothetical protein